MAVRNVTTVDPSRTFWDKVVILHGLRRWWDRRGELKGGAQRVSRHYYDVFRLLASAVGQRASGDEGMAENCLRHARMFFNRPHLDLTSAVSGSFELAPNARMLADLRRDYEAMAGMIFGAVPSVDDIVAAIAQLEERLNQPASAIVIARCGVHGIAAHAVDRSSGADSNLRVDKALRQPQSFGTRDDQISEPSSRHSGGTDHRSYHPPA